MSGHTSGSHSGGCCRHLTGQGAAEHPTMHSTTLATVNYPAHKASSAEGERPWFEAYVNEALEGSAHTANGI